MAHADNDYDWEVGKLEVSHGATTAVLSAVLVFPCPPCQAAAVAAMVLSEIVFAILRENLQDMVDSFNAKKTLCSFEATVKEAIDQLGLLEKINTNLKDMNSPHEVKELVVKDGKIQIILKDKLTFSSTIPTHKSFQKCFKNEGLFDIGACLQEGNHTKTDLTFEAPYDRAQPIILPSTPSQVFHTQTPTHAYHSGQEIDAATDVNTYPYIKKLRDCPTTQYIPERERHHTSRLQYSGNCPIMTTHPFITNIEPRNTKFPMVQSYTGIDPGLGPYGMDRITSIYTPQGVYLQHAHTKVQVEEPQVTFMIPPGLEKAITSYGPGQYPVKNKKNFHLNPRYTFTSSQPSPFFTVILQPGAQLRLGDPSMRQGTVLLSEARPGQISGMAFTSKTNLRIYMRPEKTEVGGQRSLQDIEADRIAAEQRGESWWIPGHTQCDRVENPKGKADYTASSGARPKTTPSLNYTDVNIGDIAQHPEIYISLQKQTHPGRQAIPLTTMRLDFKRQRLELASLGQDGVPDSLLRLNPLSYFQKAIQHHIGEIPLHIPPQTIVEESYTLPDHQEVRPKGFIVGNQSGQSYIVPMVFSQEVADTYGIDFINSFTLLASTFTADENFKEVYVNQKRRAQAQTGVFWLYSEQHKTMAVQVDENPVTLLDISDCYGDPVETLGANGQHSITCNGISLFEDHTPAQTDTIALVNPERVGQEENWLGKIEQDAQSSIGNTDTRSKRSHDPSQPNTPDNQRYEINQGLQTTEGQALKATVYNDQVFLRAQPTDPNTQESVVQFIQIGDTSVAVIAQVSTEESGITTTSTSALSVVTEPTSAADQTPTPTDEQALYAKVTQLWQQLNSLPTFEDNLKAIKKTSALATVPPSLPIQHTTQTTQTQTTTNTHTLPSTISADITEIKTDHSTTGTNPHSSTSTDHEIQTTQAPTTATHHATAKENPRLKVVEVGHDIDYPTRSVTPLLKPGTPTEKEKISTPQPRTGSQSTTIQLFLLAAAMTAADFEQKVHSGTISSDDLQALPPLASSENIARFEIDTPHQSIAIQTTEGLLLDYYIDPAVDDSQLSLIGMTPAWFQKQGIDSTDTAAIARQVQFVRDQYQQLEGQPFFFANLKHNPTTTHPLLQGGYQKTWVVEPDTQQGFLLDWSDVTDLQGLGPRQYIILGHLSGTQPSLTLFLPKFNQLIIMRPDDSGVFRIPETLDCAQLFLHTEDDQVALDCIPTLDRGNQKPMTLPVLAGIDQLRLIPSDITRPTQTLTIPALSASLLKTIIIEDTADPFQARQKLQLPQTDQEIGDQQIPHIIVQTDPQTNTSDDAHTHQDLIVSLLIPSEDPNIHAAHYIDIRLINGLRDGILNPNIPDDLIQYGTQYPNLHKHISQHSTSTNIPHLQQNTTQINNTTDTAQQ